MTQLVAKTMSIHYLRFLGAILICSHFSILAEPLKLNHDALADIVFGESINSISLPFRYQGAKLEGCQYVTVEKYPDISVMLVDNIITRIDSNNTKLITANSPFYGLATNAMKFTAFRKNYPEIEVLEHEYENGFYLRWYNKQQDKGIVVDYINGKVTAIKAGLIPSVLFVEGCA